MGVKGLTRFLLECAQTKGLASVGEEIDLEGKIVIVDGLCAFQGLPRLSWPYESWRSENALVSALDSGS